MLTDTLRAIVIFSKKVVSKHIIIYTNNFITKSNGYNQY